MRKAAAPANARRVICPEFWASMLTSFEKLLCRGFSEFSEQPVHFVPGVVMHQSDAQQSAIRLNAQAFGEPESVEVSVPYKNPFLAQALRELLADRAALTEMCVRARAAANGRYSWEAIAAAHIELYEGLLQAGERR